MLYEIGRAPRCLPRASLGQGAHLPCLTSNRPRRLNAWVPWWRHADHELGGVRIFHQTAPVPLALERALQTRAFAELPEASQTQELGSLTAAFVFSRAVQAGLVASGQLPPERVHLVPVGCEHWARELSGPLPAPTRPRVAMLGRERAVERRGLWRELASARGWEWLELGPGTPESELPRAVAGCSAILHLTDAIGTPVTALECIRLGVPIVTREAEVFRSALGSAGLWADPADPGSVDAALSRAFELRRDPLWQEQARRQSEPCSWSACARAHLEVWRRL